MTTSVKISVIGIFTFLSATLYSQSDSLGLPGDNLDLKAVLSIFKQSSSVEDFEKRLNSADSKVNNLDLNNDNQVDYLRVVDYGKDDFHSIVIQDPVSKLESQDVAVIEVVKKGDNTAHIQIVGDETLYGKNYIIEPKDQAPLRSEKNNTATDDVYEPANNSDVNTQVMVNVWAWPSVAYIYSPGYTYWVSPWYWGYYPGWYSPWRPYGWYAYHSGWIGYNYGFYGYRRHHHAFPHVHNYYYGRRVSSGYVQKTAPHYNRRRDDGHMEHRRDPQRQDGSRDRSIHRDQPRNSGNRDQGRTRSQNDRIQNNSQNRPNSTRSDRRSNSDNRTNQRNNNPSGDRGQRINNSPRSNQGQGGSPRINNSPRSGQSPGGGSPRSGGGGGGGNGGGRR